jgi:hypothetical protein
MIIREAPPRRLSPASESDSALGELAPGGGAGAGEPAGPSGGLGEPANGLIIGSAQRRPGSWPEAQHAGSSHAGSSQAPNKRPAGQAGLVRVQCMGAKRFIKIELPR